MQTGPRVGDRVQVYSKGQQKWFQDGEIVEVSRAMIRVRFNRKTNEQTVTLAEAGTHLKLMAQGGLGASANLQQRGSVMVHVYNLGHGGMGIGKANKVMRLFGGGIFHAGVEVYGKEWSYGMSSVAGDTGADGDGEYVYLDPDQTGVTWNDPKHCDAHRYRESVLLGHTKLGEAQVNAVVQQMMKQWLAVDYDLTRHNCCSFSDAFAQALGVGGIPPFIHRMAQMAAPVENIKESGIQFRGGDEDDGYQFGDLTRGVLAQGARQSEKAVNWMQKKVTKRFSRHGGSDSDD